MGDGRGTAAPPGSAHGAAKDPRCAIPLLTANFNPESF